MRVVSTAALGAKHLVGRMIRIIPERVLAAITPRGFRFDPSDLPAPPVAPATPIRLFIGPVNWAGQAWQWARAAERAIEGVGAVTMAYRLSNDFGFPIDQSVPVGAYLLSRRWQDCQREAVFVGFTHVMIEAERQLFGRVLDRTVEHEVRALQSRGIAVIALCHGSDILLPSRHAARIPQSPYSDPQAARSRKLERSARKNRAVLDAIGVPVVVSTPDLLIDVPEAHWLPVVIEPARWRTDAALLERARPVVVHAPSLATKKGSDLIDPIMRALDAAGIVEYRRLSGIPAAEMPAAYAAADIVLEQFRVGTYGVAACEALAAGRVVVSNVTDQVRDHVLAATGLALPIVEATAETLESVIRAIIADREPYRLSAAAGIEFVAAVHDGRRSAEVLRPFLTGAPL